MICLRCDGHGSVLKETGEKVTWDQLSERERAEVLLHGGRYERVVKVACPRCKGTGKRRLRWPRWRKR